MNKMFVKTPNGALYAVENLYPEKLPGAVKINGKIIEKPYVIEGNSCGREIILGIFATAERCEEVLEQMVAYFSKGLYNQKHIDPYCSLEKEIRVIPRIFKMPSE